MREGFGMAHCLVPDLRVVEVSAGARPFSF
jgi:hypothetical protein